MLGQIGRPARAIALTDRQQSDCNFFLGQYISNGYNILNQVRGVGLSLTGGFGLVSNALEVFGMGHDVFIDSDLIIVMNELMLLLVEGD